MPDDDPDTAVTNLVRQHWNRRADSFDEQPQHAMHSDEQRERWLSVLGAWTADPPRGTLDVGCGTGTISVLLAELGHEVLGVDAAPAMVQRARQKAADAGHDIRFGLGDATALGLVDDAVEQVVERHLLWTVPDPAAALAEYRRVTAPGGRIVVFEGRWDFEEHREEYAEINEDLPLYRGRTEAGWRDLLADSGLVDVASEPLTDPVLRGGEVEHDYFVVAGTVPS